MLTSKHDGKSRENKRNSRPNRPSEVSFIPEIRGPIHKNLVIKKEDGAEQGKFLTQNKADRF
jgi:hypothetical protein